MGPASTVEAMLNLIEALNRKGYYNTRTDTIAYNLALNAYALLCVDGDVKYTVIDDKGDSWGCQLVIGSSRGRGSKNTWGGGGGEGYVHGIGRYQEVDPKHKVKEGGGGEEQKW